MSSRSNSGPYRIISPSLDRQLTIDAFAALPANHLMTALLELDVTTALKAIDEARGRGVRVSLFAFLVRAIAVAIAEHPDLNLVCHGKRLIRFGDVDVSVPLEVTTPEGRFPREVVVRRAQALSAAEIYAEIEAARSRHQTSGVTSIEDRRSRQMMRLLRFAPRFIRILLLRVLTGNAFKIKHLAGTTLVTLVGKFASIPGFAFTFTTGPRASTFAIGSVVDKPWIHDGQIAMRKILALSVMINHDSVDGAPAARFARRLQELVESGAGLQPRAGRRCDAVGERSPFSTEALAETLTLRASACRS